MAPVRNGCGCSSGVERNLAKVDVEGSNPFARSNFRQVLANRAFFIACKRGNPSDAIKYHQPLYFVLYSKKIQVLDLIEFVYFISRLKDLGNKSILHINIRRNVRIRFYSGNGPITTKKRSVNDCAGNGCTSNEHYP